jgi:membrane peptidoglycan carboxypeptidase
LEKWGLPSRISVPIGYEITLTPIQVAAAAAAIVNNGHYMQPHVLLEVRTAKNELIRRFEPRHIRDVCSPQTTRIMLDLMEEVVLHGTGKDAAVPGYRVGGKTGTTVKAGPSGGGEGDESPTPGKRYYASFIGVIPLEKPRLVIYTWIDEPLGEKYGGTVAAPIFRMVAEQAVRMLGIEPSSDPALAIAAKSDTDKAGKPAKPQATPAPALAEMPAVALPDSQGTMPDLTGLTMLEAASRLQHLKADAKMVGWGVAVRQQPPPGTPLEASTRGLVVFDSPNP